MASEVDIANLALSRLGDDATVSNFDPPEGSAQAEHCARFYPVARDSLLELHDWKFASKRIALAEVTNPDHSGYSYAYAEPANAIRIISILPPTPPDNYAATLGNLSGYTQPVDPSVYSDPGFDTTAYYIPQPFEMETDEDGVSIILTNQPQAIARYTIRVSDTTKFSPLFLDTLGWYLASMLAGPIIKGDVGQKVGDRCLARMELLLGRAQVSDARQREVKPFHNVPWIASRR